MTGKTAILDSPAARDRVKLWADKAPEGYRVRFDKPRRSNAQNARMWVLLSITADEVEWFGVKLSAEDWKLVFLQALKKEARIVPALDQDGFVTLNASSSRLSKEDMSDMIELIQAFLVKRGVDLKERADEQ